MSINHHTLAEVLDHHGIGHTEDDVRAEGIFRVCLGCASVYGVKPGTPEAERVTTRDAIDWDAADCCPDADTYVY